MIKQVIEKGLQTDFEKVVVFLQRLNVFKNEELSIILPLANSVKRLKFKLGERVLREGEVPQGLYMVYKGRCKVCCQKINILSKK